MERRELGKYIVADPKICHGKPTFRGTRIMVWQVLEMVAKEKNWNEIIRLWGGKVSREAIAEAIHVASVALTPEHYAPYPEAEEESKPDLAYQWVIERKVVTAWPRKEFGKYIAADPKVCRGKPVFRGTRITVRQALKLVAEGMDWETISRKWEGIVSKKAIAEALLVAAQALAEHENRRPPWLDLEDDGYEPTEEEVREWTEAKSLGKHIVANPRVCHGQVTFRGTRIFVKDALEMVAEGMDWDKISWEWDGKVTKAAIAEAILVAAEALETHESQVAPEPKVVHA